MATTSPDNLRTPNPGDPYNLVPDLAILSADTQSALNLRANMYRGTAAQRVASIGQVPGGALWADVDGIDLPIHQLISGSWVRIYQSGPITTIMTPQPGRSLAGCYSISKRFLSFTVRVQGHSGSGVLDAVVTPGYRPVADWLFPGVANGVSTPIVAVVSASTGNLTFTGTSEYNWISGSWLLP